MKNCVQNQRELDAMLLKCGLSDKQIQTARKVMEQNEYESSSNFGNTRYGGSMRGSSLDSRGGEDRRTPNMSRRGGGASGSDGFNERGFSDSKSMQGSFMNGSG
jgi:hypothetical protein